MVAAIYSGEGKTWAARKREDRWWFRKEKKKKEK